MRRLRASSGHKPRMSNEKSKQANLTCLQLAQCRMLTESNTSKGAARSETSCSYHFASRRCENLARPITDKYSIKHSYALSPRFGFHLGIVDYPTLIITGREGALAKGYCCSQSKPAVPMVDMKSLCSPDLLQPLGAFQVPCRCVWP